MKILEMIRKAWKKDFKQNKKSGKRIEMMKKIDGAR
jgi:hypothetical protein